MAAEILLQPLLVSRRLGGFNEAAANGRGNLSLGRRPVVAATALQ